MPALQIGIDDTDSKEGMCTTYLGAVLVDELTRLEARIVDYPRLIRLNPNWPMKTRGNCSVAIAIEITDDKISFAKSKVIETVSKFAEIRCETTNPGVVFFKSLNPPAVLRRFSQKVIKDTVTIEEAEELAHRIGAEVHKFKIGRGIIGALAAIGETLEGDKTFELVAYRIPEKRGTKREIDLKSVLRMEELTYPNTFDNIDHATKEIRITPHAPCPILYGVRAENPVVAMDAHKIVKSYEPKERWIIYKTNQATDSQYIEAPIKEVKPYSSAIINGIVSSMPKIIPGGHVIFILEDDGSEIYCAAYEPTREFRKVVERLIVGDLIKVYGGVKEKADLPLTLNLEKLDILKLAPLIKKRNPICEKCGKRAKSAGKNKGYVCKKCKVKFSEDSAIYEESNRNIAVGIYEVPPRARRHLTKPLIRLFNKKQQSNYFDIESLYF